MPIQFVQCGIANPCPVNEDKGLGPDEKKFPAEVSVLTQSRACDENRGKATSKKIINPKQQL